MIELEQIAARLRQCREERNLRLKDAADGMGIARNRLSNWESPNMSPPKITGLDLAAAFYKVNPAWLVGWADSPEPNSSGNYTPTPDRCLLLLNQTTHQIPAQPRIAWHHSWLAENDIAANEMAEVIAPDNSMAPDIQQGDLVTLDTRPATAPHSDLIEGIYALLQGDRIFIRKITPDIGRTLITAANTPAEQGAPLDDSIHVLGRVRAITRNL